MGNTSKAKLHLVEAIRNLPDDFALSSARFHLNTAFREITKLEKKRTKRESMQINSVPGIARVTNAPMQQSPVAKQWSPEQLANALDIIDSMIEEEQKKLKPKNNDKSTEIDTLLG